MVKRVVLIFCISLFLFVPCACEAKTDEIVQQESIVEIPVEGGEAQPVQESMQEEIPLDEELVRVQDFIPELYVDLKYATTDNFTGQVIYDFSDALLCYGTVKKLMQVQDKLEGQGYNLLIWDAYRPVQAQFTLWNVCPNSAYVANPHRGYSSHSRGNTVDVSLVTQGGEKVVMPSSFDDFSALSDRDYSDVSQEAREHARLLEDVMVSCGFKGYNEEWWHYSDTNAYDVLGS